MRVAFLVPSLEPSGGVLTVVQHARLLRERAQIDAGQFDEGAHQQTGTEQEDD